jgi:hypothetical protein
MSEEREDFNESEETRAEERSQTHRLTWLLAGVAIGAVGMYVLDPDRGLDRRMKFKNSAVGLKKQTQDLAMKARQAGQAFRHQAQGVVNETSKYIQ